MNRGSENISDLPKVEQLSLLHSSAKPRIFTYNSIFLV